MGRRALVAGGANVGMGGMGFLQQRAEVAGVVGRLAAQDLTAEIDVAEQPIQRIFGVVVGGGVAKNPSVIAFQWAAAESARSSLLLKWWKKLPLVTPASAQMSSTVEAA